MKNLLVIVGDTNDADYITETHLLDPDEIYDAELLSLLPKVSKALKDCKDRHNWPDSEYSKIFVRELYNGILTDEDIDIFQEYAPHGEYGIHTIKSIDVYDINDVVNYF